MGGGNYDGDVAARSRVTTSNSDFQFTRHVRDNSRPVDRDVETGRRIVNKKMSPKNTKRECCDSPEHKATTPIVVAVDLTASRGKDVLTVFGKLPMFIGQIHLHNIVPDPQVSFAGVADAASGDEVPIQVGQFESDNRLDQELKDMVIEEGGGGTGQENYELTVYYYARHCELDANKRDAKGYFFILGDEGFYPTVKKDLAKVFIGDDLSDDLPSAEVFGELQKKFHAFFLFQRQSEKDRKAGIDQEIRQRVLKAGGQYENVDFRASLMWQNRNDLDLHVVTPSGWHIYYGAKRSPCGGWLDVDMNVSGETTKPVENIRWAKGSAPDGKYRVFVRNFNFHEGRLDATAFKVEVEVNGEIKHFEGQTPSGTYGEASDQLIGEFEFDSTKRPGSVAVYESYREEVILDQWKSVLPSEHVLTVSDPKGVVDVMLGVLAIHGGSTDIDGYLKQMDDRGQTPARCAETKESLQPLVTVAETTVSLPKSDRSGALKSRRGRIQRL